MKIAALAALIVIVFGAVNGSACDCSDWNAREKYKQTAVIFRGTVTKISSMNSDGFPLSIRFKVQKQWKGTRTQEIELPITWDWPGMCGDFGFALGETYLVYAFHDDSKKLNFPDLWTTADCTPNLPVKDANEEMKDLDRIVKEGGK